MITLHVRMCSVLIFFVRTHAPSNHPSFPTSYRRRSFNVVRSPNVRRKVVATAYKTNNRLIPPADTERYRSEHIASSRRTFQTVPVPRALNTILNILNIIHTYMHVCGRRWSFVETFVRSDDSLLLSRASTDSRRSSVSNKNVVKPTYVHAT